MRTAIALTFAEDLVASALSQITDDCVLVFPSKISAAEARRRFFPTWELQQAEFVSMDELKQGCILPQAPFVGDDKRLLCLWQVLEDEDREYFHLSGYFDIVQWGGLFFQFFDELCDECVEADKLLELNASGTFNLIAWQEQYIQRIMAIRQRYKSFLGSKGFTDRIFFYRPERIAKQGPGKRYVFVNQYYYSKLEQELIGSLEASGNEIVIISQGPCSELDPQRLTPPLIVLDRLKPEEIRTTEIEVWECENEDQMGLAFLARQARLMGDGGSRSAVIDRLFYQKPYRGLFDPGRFDQPHSKPLIESQLYALLQIFQRQLSALADSLKQRFIPLRLILDACAQPGFVRFYRPDWGLEEQQKLLSELKALINKDILYLDKELELFQLGELELSVEWLPRLLTPHFALLEKLGQIDGIEALIALLDSPEGLSIRGLCSQTELEYSNILEQVYERLANFGAIDRLGIVSSWKGLFASEGVRLAANILELLLEAIASASFSYDHRASARPACEISNLLDSRNLSYDNLVFLNAIEGELPSNPNSVWLFNETQRGKLGLKSYPQLRERERYYFLRQVFCSQRTVIYTYRNQELDLEPGSFVTELLHASTQGELASLSVSSKKVLASPSLLYQARQRVYPPRNGMGDVFNDHALCGLDTTDPAVFFVLPSDPEQDLGSQRRVMASSYSTQALLKNPFAWYIKEFRRIQPCELRQQETISRKLFGAIMHGFLSEVLLPLAEEHLGTAKLEAAFSDVDALRRTLLELLANTLYLYKIPQNYNHTFLTGIISDCLAESVAVFYREFLAQRLKNKRFTLIPEARTMTPEERAGRTLCLVKQGDHVYELRIRGRADLRIDCAGERIIIDFKTGEGNLDQLIFYEWFYYLLPADCPESELDSKFWMILEQQVDTKKVNSIKRHRWKSELEELFHQCLELGYGLGKTLADRRILAEVTRADLYRQRFGGER